MRRHFALLATLQIPLLLCACAVFSPPPLATAQTQADVLRMLGTPTARYAMPSNATRLEFARGPMGRETWMVNIDAASRVTGWMQALEERRLRDFQARAPGMSRDELLRTLGTPGERRPGGRQGGEVWSYRFPTNECMWFQVSLGDDGVVRDGTFGIDWSCDRRDSRGRM